jgi:hypothetical protein
MSSLQVAKAVAAPFRARNYVVDAKAFFAWMLFS